MRADQPIVENYVGRQIPTAMVARNLHRGSGFGQPQLDTGPFPNLFLVEPPVYAAAVVAFQRATGAPLEASGRLVSALAAVLGAWGLYGLARRRGGEAVAMIAVLALALFPVSIRYGRAFQPDMFMLGSLLAGLRLWDDCTAEGGWPRLAAAWGLLAVGFATKVLAAYLLLPLALLIPPPRRIGMMLLALASLGPALLWYGLAAGELAHGSGSRASAENAAIWSRTLLAPPLLRLGTYTTAARFLCVRAFTPPGFLLAVWGLFGAGRADRLWRVWAISAAAALAILAGKIHHEYYWLALAPPLAVGLGQAVVSLSRGARSGVMAAFLGLLAFVALAFAQSSSTWRTPPEWRTLAPLAATIREQVPAADLIIAPEALIYAADRRGCRLETGRAAARRAAGAWG
ncbi:MAG: glycosyltransferase family 39 protein, partial [Isosphaeraceae bacterium]|nr:glycosyltransferase family 39 protein [Isosphaeraceae bacterium]